MLRNLKTLYGYKLCASNGDIGQVKDFYFDDKTWVVRYLVADTGTWLTGRLVLISPHAFGRFEEVEGKVMLINLTRQQIENSPSIESHQPVSRQHEAEYYRHYGWPAYWDGGAMWGLGGYPVVAAPSKEELAALPLYHHRDDKHLQSARAIDGYEIQAVDGTIGQVSGLMVDDRSWAVRKLVVETGHWYSGKEIFIALHKIARINYNESKVFVNLFKEDIQQTSENETAKAVAES
jgi:sporulation protein YlmC with PRC-barrel domain